MDEHDCLFFRQCCGSITGWGVVEGALLGHFFSSEIRQIYVMIGIQGTEGCWLLLIDKFFLACDRIICECGTYETGTVKRLREMFHFTLSTVSALKHGGSHRVTDCWGNQNPHLNSKFHCELWKMYLIQHGIQLTMASLFAFMSERWGPHLSDMKANSCYADLVLKFLVFNQWR
jgi:hypothetical protein